MRRRRKRKKISPLAAGAIGIVVLALLAYLAFTKFANPFANPFTIHATFSSVNSLRPDSLVRIAGVNVGKVKSISTVARVPPRRAEPASVLGRRRDDDDRPAGAATPH